MNSKIHRGLCQTNKQFTDLQKNLSRPLFTTYYLHTLQQQEAIHHYTTSLISSLFHSPKYHMRCTVLSESFATILPILHNHHSLQTKHIMNHINFFSSSLQFQYNIDALQTVCTFSQAFSVPTNSSRQYHNQRSTHIPSIPSLNLVYSSSSSNNQINPINPIASWIGIRIKGSISHPYTNASPFLSFILGSSKTITIFLPFNSNIQTQSDQASLSRIHHIFNTSTLIDNLHSYRTSTQHQLTQRISKITSQHPHNSGCLNQAKCPGLAD